MAINAGTILAYLDMDTSKFSSALHTAQNQLSSFSEKGSGMSGLLNGIGSAATTVGRAMTMGITLPLIGLGTAAIKTGMDFEKSLSMVQAITGMTASEMKSVHDLALKLGSAGAYSATEIANATKYFAVAGLDAEEASRRMTASMGAVVDIATSAQLPLAQTAEIMSATMQSFGADAEEARRYADVLAAVTSVANTEVANLGEAFKYAAPIAAMYGYTLEDTSVALAAMANSGIQGSIAGTTLTRAMDDLHAITPKTWKDLKKLGIQLPKVDFSTMSLGESMDWLRTNVGKLSAEQQALVISTLFSTAAQKGMAAVISTSEEDWESYAVTISEAGEATMTLADGTVLVGMAAIQAHTATDNLKGDLDKLKGNIGNTAISLSEFLSPALRQVTQWLTKGVTWFNSLSTSAKNLVFKIGTIAAAIGPVLLVGGKLLTLTSGFLGPLALVGGALALVYKHSERLQGAGSALSAVFGKLTTFAKYFSSNLQRGVSVTAALRTAIAGTFGRATLKKIDGVVQTLYNGFAQVKKHVSTGLNAVGSFLGALIDGKPAAEALEKSLTMIFGQETAQKIIATATAIAGGFRTAFDFVKTGVISTANAIQTGFAAVKNKVVTMAGEISTAWSEGGVMGVLRLVGQYLLHGLQAAAGAALNGARFVRDKIVGGLAMAKEWLLPKVQTWLGNLGDAFVSAKTWVTNKLPAVKTAIADGFAMAKEWLLPKVQTWLGNLGDAFVTAKTWVTSKLTTVKDAIADGFAMAQEWLLPKVQTWLGNLGDAFVAAKTYVTDKLPDLKDAILDGLIAAKETITTKAQNMLTWLGTALQSEEAKAFLGDLSAVGGWILEKVTWAQTTLTTKAGELVNALGTALGSDTVKATVTSITGVVATIAEKITSSVGAWQTTAARLIADLIAQLTNNEFLTTAVTGLGGIVTAIATGLGTAASNITGCAGTIISALLDKFSETGFIEGLFTTAGTVVTNIATVIGGVASNITDAASKIGTALVGAIVGLDWTIMFTTAGNVANAILDTIGSVVMDGIGAAKNIGTALITGFSGIDWTTAFTTAGTVANNVLTVIGGSVTSAVDAATSLGTALATGFGKVDWKTAFATAGTVVDNLFSQILSATDNITMGATKIAKALANSLATFDWGGCATAIATTVTKLWGGFMDNLPEALPRVGELVSKIGEGISNAASGLAEAAGTLVGKLIAYMLSPDFVRDLFNVGLSFVAAVGKGVIGAGQWLVETTAEVAASAIMGFGRGLLGVEVDPALQALYDEFSTKTYTIFDKLGNEIEVGGAYLGQTLTASMVNPGELENALQAWQIIVSNGYADAFKDAAWLSNEAVVGLFNKVSNTTLTEGERAKAAALLIGFGYGDNLENALWMSEPGVYSALLGLANAGTQDMVTMLQETGLTAGELLGFAIPDGFGVGMLNGKAVLINHVGDIVDIASFAKEQATIAASATDTGEAAVNAVGDGQEAAQPGLETTSGDVVTAVVDAYDPLPDELKDITDDGMTGMAAAILDGQDPATEAALTVSDAVVERFLLTMSAENGTNLGTAFTGAITAAITNSQTIMTTAANTVAEAVRVGMANILSMPNGQRIGIDFTDGITGGVRNRAPTLLSTIRSAANDVVSSMRNIMSTGTGYSIGQAMIQAVASGASSMGGYLNSAMRSLANSAVAAFKSAIQMHSPPRVFTDIGEMIPLAVGIGADSNQGAATQAMQRLADSLVDAWDSPDLGLGWPPANPRSGGGLDGQGFVLNFYGDMHIREDADIDRISQGIYEQFSDNSRGGGVR